MKYFLLFLIYSFIGWFIEVLLSLYYKKKFVNRGFLIGPYCPIWGFGCIMIIIILKRYINDPITLFIMSMLICGVLEYTTSYLMEKIFKARWWDYKNNKFNINGRVCLETIIPFGIGGLLLIYFINPVVEGFIDMIPIFIQNIIGIIMFIIFISDCIISFNIINNIKDLSISSKRDSTEEISRYVKKVLTKKSYLYRRLGDAFPNFELNIDKIKIGIDKSRKKLEKRIDKTKNKMDKLVEKQKDKNKERLNKLKIKQKELEEKLKKYKN